MSEFEFLKSFEEQILQEILDDNSQEYWENRFYSADKKENTLLWAAFGELKRRRLISYRSYDNSPAIIEILAAGYSYFDDKEEYQKEIKRKEQSDKRHKLKDTLIGAGTDILTGEATNIITKGGI